MAGPVEGGGPEGTDDREETPPPLMKEQIEGHVSALKSLVKSHKRRNKGDTEVHDYNFVKGREVIDKDLKKPFKEAQRTPLTRRIIEFTGSEYKMPNNIKFYDGTTDPEDHLSHFASAANSGEWPMPVWCRMFQQTLDGSARGWFERLPPDSINEWVDLREAFAARLSVRRTCFKEPHEITKIIRRANESLTAFKERWTVETDFIMRIPEVMKISSFMDSVKSPELAKHFSDKVPTTVNEMMERMDDFVRSKKAYASTELPKGEMEESHRKMSFPSNERDVWPLRNTRPRESQRDDYRNRHRGRDTYRTYRPMDDRAPYPPPRGNTAGESHRLGNTDQYCDYHQEKGHYTNDCIQLRKQLEMALKSGKLNHIVKELCFHGEVLADFLSEAPERGKGRIVLLNAEEPNGIEYTYALRLTFLSTNNKAEYEALLAGLRIARRMNISNIEVKVDSKLVASQINGSYEASKDSMIKYLAKAKEYTSGFKSLSIENIPWNMNQKADVLSKLTSVAFNHLMKEVLVEVLNERSTKGQEIHTIVEEEWDNWMTPNRRCLEEGIWPKEKNEARCLRAKIGQYANYVIREIHMRSYGMQVGPRAVVRKEIRQGYYWPTMHKDAKKEVKNVTLGHGHSRTTTTCKEEEPDSFGLPRIIITDNGAQLVNDPFKSWCGRFEIHQMNTAVAHPQANTLVERANKSLMEGIKTRLEREKAGWVDELPNVLWAHRTSIKQNNEETPFSLTYGSEAVIPTEIGIHTYQTLMIKEEYNKEEMRLNLDLLQEMRETVAVREARYKTKMEQYYNKKVRPTGFRTREFVFRRNEASRVEDQGKLGPKLEGPYRAVKAYENGSYKLQTLEDKEVPRTWHAINLRKCYM
nr:reverse transcriptase domain-containing protein [Tanacetum cinerariifolium]